MLNLVIDASSLRGGLPVNEVTQIFKEKLGMDIESFNPQTYGFYDVTCLFKYLQSIRMCKLKGNKTHYISFHVFNILKLINLRISHPR